MQNKNTMLGNRGYKKGVEAGRNFALSYSESDAIEKLRSLTYRGKKNLYLDGMVAGLEEALILINNSPQKQEVVSDHLKQLQQLRDKQKDLGKGIEL